MGSRRLMHLGFDGMNLLLLRRFAAEGIIPNFAELLRRGSSNRLLCTVPAWTPTNWASMLTGTSTGTHGLGGWSLRDKRDPWEKPRLRNEDSRSMKADTIWEAGARAGLVSMASFFPASWPSRIPGGFVIAPGFRYPPFALAFPELYIIGGTADADREGGYGSRIDPVSTNLAETGSDAPVTYLEGTHAELTVSGRHPSESLGSIRFDTSDRLWVAGGCSPSDYSEVHEDRWSKWLVGELLDEGDLHRVAFRVRLLKKESGTVHLIRSEAHRIDGFTDPPELAPELVDRFGPFTGIFSVRPSPGEAELNAVLDEYRDQGLWMARVARHLLDTRGWDMHFCHWHLFDTINHAHVNPLDPEGPEYDAGRADWHLNAHRRAFMVADEVLAEFLHCADEDTVIFLNADHAMAPAHRWASVPAMLIREGLLVYEDDGVTPDWSRSVAYVIPERGSEIFINLKGREPYGIVDSSEYHATCEHIIDLLHGWRDGEDNRKIVALALKLEDSQLIGFWGEQNGDVIFTFNRGFGWGSPRDGGEVGPAWEALHGSQIPTSEKGELTNMGCLLAAGPGLRQGYERDWQKHGLMRMVDLAPTIAQVMGCQPPKQNLGAVLWDLLTTDK